MTTENNDPDYEERARALAVIDTEFPGWHAWPAVLAGLVYARRPRTTPPLVVRSVSMDGLREQIIHAEEARGLR